jgi:hypothetical protein
MLSYMFDPYTFWLGGMAAGVVVPVVDRPPQVATLGRPIMFRPEHDPILASRPGMGGVRRLLDAQEQIEKSRRDLVEV